MKIHGLLRSPIRKNLLANFFGVGVQLLNQIVLVPFYILFWGNDLYSDWIVISALTTIFAISDVGLNNVIQNRFSIKLSEKNFNECNALLTDNFILVFVTLLITMLGGAAFIFYWDITQVMSLHVLNRNEASVVFLLLIAKVFVGMVSGVENAIYRATHNAGIAVYMDQIGNLCSAIIILLCILLSINIVVMSCLFFAPQVIIVLIKHLHSKRYFHYEFRLAYANWPLFRSVLLPSFSFMSFPVGNAIVLQGYTLLVNTYFGAESVVVYNTTRTLCNFVKTIIGTLLGAVWPEYSIAYGKKDYALMRHLHRKIIKITIFFSASSGVALLLLGPLIYRLWTHNSVPFNWSLTFVFVVVLFMESLWSSSSVTLMATNNHSKLGLVFITGALFSIGLAYLLIDTAGWTRLDVMTSSLIVLHSVMACYAINAGFRLTKDSVFAR